MIVNVESVSGASLDHSGKRTSQDKLAGLKPDIEAGKLVGKPGNLIIGMEDTERHKPDPEPVLEALRRLGASPSEAAYVGDSPFDIAAGKGAGVLAVGVTWGGIHSAERLAEERPDALVSSAEELHDVL